MKIAVQASWLAPESIASGFGRYLHGLLFHALALDAEHEWHLFSPKPLSVVPPRGTVHVVEGGPAFFPDAMARSEAFRRLDPDVLFLPHAEMPSGLPARLRVIMTVHDVIPTLFLQPSFLLRGRTPLAMITLYGLTERFALARKMARCSDVLTVSQTSKDDLGRIFGAKAAAKTTVLLNGVDEGFRPVSDVEAAPVLARYGLTRRGYFFYYGGHTVRKNLGRAILAWRGLPEGMRDATPFVVIGDGHWARWIRRRGLGEGVVFLPKLAFAELNVLLASAAAMVYPSLYEGFGFPVLESLRAGTWPLVSDVPAHREILGPDWPAFDPRDVQGIREAMFRAVERPADRDAELLSRSRRIDGTRFRWENAARGLLRLLG